MSQQIKPEQIVDRIKELVKTQKEKGYKPGWVYHQLDDLTHQKVKHLHPYTGIPNFGLAVANGEATPSDVLSALEEDFETYQEMEKAYG